MNEIITTVEDLLKSKGVTEADRKFYDKYIAPRYAEQNIHVLNPFTEYRKVVHPVIANLVTFVQELIYDDFHPSTLKKWGVPEGRKIQLFDRAKYLVLKLDRETYSNVLD